MIFNISGNGNRFGNMPEFTYTGRYRLLNDGKKDNVQNWRIKFLTSGVLTFSRIGTNIDVFCVGGGGGGAAGGGGGGGGYTKTSKNVSVTRSRQYTINIGNGGSAGVDSESHANNNGGDGGSSSAFNVTANGGKGGIWQNGMIGTYGGAGGSGGGGFGGGDGGSDGASGGYGATNKHNPATGYPGGTGQRTNTREFGENNGALYSGGGGGGNYSEWAVVGGRGGSGGGGDGHREYTGSGHPGTDNTGGGGGGSIKSAGNYHAGKGGSGIVIIRNTR